MEGHIIDLEDRVNKLEKHTSREKVIRAREYTQGEEIGKILSQGETSMRDSVLEYHRGRFGYG